jgi:peptidoglycan hydrolase-like protein with peptidoglycan-binding domain
MATVKRNPPPPPARKPPPPKTTKPAAAKTTSKPAAPKTASPPKTTKPPAAPTTSKPAAPKTASPPGRVTLTPGQRLSGTADASKAVTTRSAFDGKKTTSPAAGAPRPTTNPPGKVTPAQTRQVDDRLRQLGFSGAQRKDAVVAFQRKNGLVPDGIVGPKTLAALGLSPPRIAPGPLKAISGGVSASVKPPPSRSPVPLGPPPRGIPLPGQQSFEAFRSFAQRALKDVGLDASRLPDLGAANLVRSATDAAAATAQALKKSPAAQRIATTFDGPVGKVFGLVGSGLTALNGFASTSLSTVQARVANAVAQVGAEAGVAALAGRGLSGAAAVVDFAVTGGAALAQRTGLISESLATFFQQGTIGSNVSGLVTNLVAVGDAVRTGDFASLERLNIDNEEFRNGTLPAAAANLAVRLGLRQAYQRNAANPVVSRAVDLFFGTIDANVGLLAGQSERAARGRRAQFNALFGGG